MQCDKMKEMVEPSDTIAEVHANCRLVDSTKTTCTIENLSMNCYKLWLEVTSPLGPIQSKPVYLTARDHGEDQPSLVVVQHSKEAFGI